MKPTALSSLLVTTYIFFVSTAHASTPAVVFSPEQEARIGEIAAEYPCYVSVDLQNNAARRGVLVHIRTSEGAGHPASLSAGSCLITC